ncbi:hypothetical protein CDAR_595851 [Caerostris darwini]|uniref:Uncharacterized protein n=1 Tax=Caerostris darwini TaxID=1538125 RepID=A0AAV4Q8E8_9ARAC|nr:hypothetical protein CDAR_595851 [Caerostris darwini]
MKQLLHKTGKCQSLLPCDSLSWWSKMSARKSDLTFHLSFFSIDMVTSGSKLTWLSRNDSLLNLDKLAVISIFPLRVAVSIIGADALNSSNDFMSVTVVVCGYGGDDLGKNL